MALRKDVARIESPDKLTVRHWPRQSMVPGIAHYDEFLRDDVNTRQFRLMFTPDLNICLYFGRDNNNQPRWAE